MAQSRLTAKEWFFGTNNREEEEFQRAVEASLRSNEEDEKLRRETKEAKRRSKKEHEAKQLQMAQASSLVAAEKAAEAAFQKAILDSLPNTPLWQSLPIKFATVLLQLVRMILAVVAKAVQLAMATREDTQAVMAAVDRCWREQEENYCGWHAVSVVLCVLELKENLTKSEFDKLRKFEITYDPSDGYTVEALQNVLDHYGLNVETIYHPIGNPDGFDYDIVTRLTNSAVPRALIIGNTNHWWAIVRKGESWFNADSQNAARRSAACNMVSSVWYFKDGIKGVIDHIRQKVSDGSLNGGGVLVIM